MAFDTFLSIANEVHDQTGLDIELCKVLTRDSFRELCERNNWSWLYKRSNLTVPAPYATGTASINQGDTLVTFSGATLTLSMVGRQFRSSTSDPFYTIDYVDTVAQTAILREPWAAANLVAGGYSIFQSYLTPPDDFFSLISVKDISRSWRLNLNIDQAVLDWYDARRSSQGSPILLSQVDYTPSYSGKVYSVVAVAGASNPAPVSGGTYTGAADALYAITITTGGTPGTAVFSWSKNGTVVASNILTSTIYNELDSGVQLTWPVGTYNVGQIFIVRATAQSSPGLPRYEIYPYPTQLTVLPIYYISRYPDISDTNVSIPRFIPGNYIKEGALAKAARVPGTGAKPDQYAQVARAENHEQRFDGMLAELMRQDSEIAPRDIGIDLPFAPLPWGQGMFNQLPIDSDPMFIYPDFR